MLKQKNTRKQGDVGLGFAIAQFTKNGWTVCIPLTDNQDFDLVVDRGNGLEKVQVKTTRHQLRPGVYAAMLCTKGGNRTSGEKVKYFDPTAVDLLYVLAGDGREYLIPTSKIAVKRSINVGIEKYKEFELTGDEV